MIGTQVHEPHPERRRRDEEDGRPGEPIGCPDVRRAALPRPGDPLRVVDGCRDIVDVGAGVGDAPIEEVEEVARRVRTGRKRPGGRGIGGDAVCDAGEHARHPVEVAAHLALETSRGSRGRGAEAPDLERRTREDHQHGGAEPGREQPAPGHRSIAKPRGNRGGH